jgi:formate hydrogenlyase subunit 6/NADH:ubiquinone oxidoreductase subunit I
MDTGEYDLADYKREDLIFTKEKLMGEYPPVANRGDAFDAAAFNAARTNAEKLSDNAEAGEGK